MNTQEQVKCGMCHSYHDSLDAMKAYHRIGVTVPQVPSLPPVVPAQSGAVAQSGLPGKVGRGRGWITLNQFNHLNGRLEQDPNVTCWYTFEKASSEIDRLHKARNGRRVPDTTKVPIPMLQALRNGYYAARQSADDDWMFFRVSHPKKNKYAGATKIQTQHGPNLKEALVVWPSGDVTVYQRSVEDNLLVVVVDPKGSGMAYADEIGRCMRCGLELTDARSRWYGIGPDCEQVWTDVVPMVNDRKGTFVHGS